jgi:two-component system chemotaxis response regulator CheB
MSGFGLVAIGVSLGGLEALRVLLPALGGARVPIAVVQHRVPSSTPTHWRALEEVCPLTICEPEDGTALEPGHVYIGPADYHLLVEPGLARLSVDEPALHARPSIDVFLESAAYAYREALLALVLTGASADGASGAAAVKARGGTLLVQSPEDAESDILPRAALRRARADRVLPLREMAAFLSGLGPLDRKGRPR